MSKINLLIISDNLSLYHSIINASLNNNYSIYFCGTQEDIFCFIKNNNIKIVLIDSERAEEEEVRLLKLIKALDPLIDVIIVGEPVASEKAVDWIKLGATDYVNKPVQKESVQLVLRKIDKKRTLRRETFLQEKRLEKKYIFQGMVGKSPFMLEVFSLIENIARYFSAVLISGDTGTGKEMVAKAIHNLNGAKNKKLVICDCVSIPENLFESELFGYVKGAFTGAYKNKKGLFEDAHEGIIFLDEIGEIPVSVQAKLLRILETHQFRPLGSNDNKYVDVRVIAASSLNLRKEIKKGTFREDLFHRLNKIEIHLPSLKERSEDIPLLVRYFLTKYNIKFGKKIKGLSRQVQKLFLSYEWPGNVRELENVIESTSILCKKEFIDVPDLPKYLKDYFASEIKIPSIDKKNLTTLNNLEEEYITYLLRKNNNNKRKTAKILNISRTTLYNKLNKYNISRQPS